MCCLSWLTARHRKSSQRDESVRCVSSPCLRSIFLGFFSLAAAGSAAVALPDHDFDDDGYVGAIDSAYLSACLSVSGPGRGPLFAECGLVFDVDDDNDVDLVDFASLQRARGHLPIPLRNLRGELLTVDSVQPFSSRQTCGPCHDIDHIANGLVFQEGRTDVDGNITMVDDFYEDGRWWVRGSGMYGRWSGGGGGLNRQTAGKMNAHESVMDMTPFYWAANCGGCHAGGGGMEFDRDGELLWDDELGLFGYEVLGKNASDVLLDGDYAFLNDSDATVSPARWDLTGVAEPECLHCHRRNRAMDGQTDLHRERRANVLAAMTDLVDVSGDPVPAFASAGTGGQGWYSVMDLAADPPVMQIDYSVGVADGSLQLGTSGELALSPGFLVAPPRDQACWGCHLPGGFQGKRGTVWFDDRDVHFKNFTNRSDDHPGNDIADEHAATCSVCHPNDLDHNFAKGNSPYAQFRNDLDWADFRSCRECHLYDSSVRHPDAPEVLGPDDSVVVHLAGDGTKGPTSILSCQACHVPYPLERANLVTDRSLTGTAVTYMTDEFLSANSLDPMDEDKTKWYPAFRKKMDSDGVERFFPQKMEVAIYWANWDQAGTQENLTDDTIQPVILWRLRQITGNNPLPEVTDDNGDGKLEVNRPAEILAYMQALKGNDSYGRQVANNPVLVKGRRIWYEDATSPDGVSSFKHEGTGLQVESFEIFGLDHNVLSGGEAWGYNEAHPELGCSDCHRPATHDAPVIDRLVLVDPWGPDGQPVYETVREMTGLNPP